MKKAIVMLAVLAVVAGSASAAEKKMGVGLGMNRADVRMVLDDKSAVDGYISFGTQSTDSDNGSSNFAIGGYYMMKIVNAKPADLHWLGGLEIGMDGMTIAGTDFSATTIALFGGIGSEYFLPGTENLSVEVNAGLRFSNQSGDAKGTSFGIDSLNGVTFRYYF